MSDDHPSEPTRRDYDLAPTVDIDSPQRLKAISHQLRQRITDLTLEHSMSVTELADRLDRPRGTVAYHVDILVDAGLLQVVRTRRVRAIEEKFYGRSGRTYIFHGNDGGDEIPFVDELIRDFDHDAFARHQTDDIAGLVTYRRARIPMERAHEYVRRLIELTHEFVDEPRAGDVEHGLFISMNPIVRHADDEEAL